jgi:ATP-dependent protease ClpP protease subunit
MREWYQFKAQADPAVAEVMIYDFIGGHVDEYFQAGGGSGVTTAKGFLAELAALPADVQTVRVRINSPGGDVVGAIAIANALREQAAKGRTVETVVDGLAASAATMIMVAGTPAKVAANAVVMVHNPWSMAVGDAAEMRKNAETLDTFRNSILGTYQWKSKLSAAELTGLMDAETWMSADEAVAYGFADEVVPAQAVAASIDAALFQARAIRVPDKYKALVETLLRKEAPEPLAVVPANINDKKAPEGEAWSAPTLEDFTSKAWTDLTVKEKDDIAGHYAWADEMPPAAFGSLKIPHHRASDGAVVLAGVEAAAARLDQAEGVDHAAVRAHLEAHYHQFDRKAPWEATTTDNTGPAPASAPAAVPLASVRAVAHACEGLDAAFLSSMLDILDKGLDVVLAQVTVKKAALETERIRVRDLTALCERFNQKDLLPEMVAGGVTVEQGKALVLKVRAKLDKVEIDSGLAPGAEGGGSKARVLSYAEIYAARNGLAK